MTRFDIPNLFQNRIPDRMIVGLLDSRAFNGDVTRDPFCFQKFSLRAIRQMVKGEEYPYEALQINRNNGARDALGYFRFLQASGAWYKKQGNMVQQEAWGQDKNCTLFMFDNVANGRADNRTLNPKQAGDLQLILEFGIAPGTNITVLVYAELENMLEIDSNGAVLYNIYQLLNMEQVALNNVRLNYLAREDPVLKLHFYGTVGSNRLPKKPLKTQPQAYIVNTDPHHQPGEHWLALWTHGNVCEVLESYALPIEKYEQDNPFERMDRSALEVRGDQWQIPSSHQQ